ncbi:MAG: hypothetical protein ABI823_08780 [Bryobacteraceae bacterium]
MADPDPAGEPLTSDNPSEEKRKRNSARYRACFLEVRAILNRYDPAGIAFIEDEYDPEVAELVAGLEKAVEPADSIRVLNDVFLKWFSAPCPPAIAVDLARDLWLARERTRD